MQFSEISFCLEFVLHSPILSQPKSRVMDPGVSVEYGSGLLNEVELVSVSKYGPVHQGVKLNFSCIIYLPKY